MIHWTSGTTREGYDSPSLREALRQDHERERRQAKAETARILREINRAEPATARTVAAWLSIACFIAAGALLLFEWITAR